MSQDNEVVNRRDIGLLRERVSFWRAADRTELLTRMGYFLLAAIMGLAFVFPLYWLVKISVMWPSANLYGGVPTLGIENPSLANFSKVLFEVEFLTFLFNTAFIAVTVVGANLILNSLAAYGLTLDFRGRRLVQGFLVANMMIPAQTVIIPAFLVSQRLGLLNNRFGVVLPLAVIIINIFILYTSFDAVPQSMIESARLDGASELYIIFGIYWPLSKAALAANVILAFVFAWNTYIWPLLILNQQELMTLTQALASFQGNNQGRYGLMYAFTLMAVVPMIVLFLLLQKQFIESAVMGSIKE
jgi:ABC-type glycerol-3-phosphate transport system permease component